MALKDSYWPEGYTPPPWLPNWENETEYSQLLSRITYTYKTISPKSKKKRNPDPKGSEIESFRRLDQDSIKRKKVITSKTAFAWEFLRRNPYYQADFQRLFVLSQTEGCEKYYTSGIGFNILQKGQAPTPSLDFHAELYRTLTRWGLSYRLFDPASNLHETGPLEAGRRFGNDFYLAQEVCEVAGETIPLDGGIIPTDSEAVWLFDVSLPLQPQFEAAILSLEASQISREGKKIQKSKTELDTYITYLRLLDADVSGVGDEQIARVLFSKSNSSKYYNNTPHRDALNKARRAANALKDRLYRHLL